MDQENFTILHDLGSERLLYYPHRQTKKYVFQERKFNTVGQEIWKEILDLSRQMEIRKKIKPS